MRDKRTPLKHIVETYRAARAAATGERKVLDMSFINNHCDWLVQSLGHVTLEEMALDPVPIMSAHFDRRRNGEISWTEADGRYRGGPQRLRGQSVKDCTLRHDITILMAAYNYCAGISSKGGLSLEHPDRISRDYIPNFSDIRPAQGKANERWLSRDEAKCLLTAAQPPNAPRLTRAFRALLLGLFCGGPRKEAMQNLQWPRIIIQTIRDPRTGQPQKIGYVDYNEPDRKDTAKRRAVVAIPTEVLHLFERAERERTSDYFLDSQANLTKTIETAYRYAGLSAVNRKIHILRTTFATWASQDGVPMEKIAEAMNDDIETVTKHYAKFSPLFQSEIRERISLDGFAGLAAQNENNEVTEGVRQNSYRRRW